MSKGAGAALMHSPEKIHEIVQAMVQAVSIPITVKTRIGLTPDTINISETSHAAEDAGASAIFIHARPASNRHSGPADWQCLAKVKAELSIPVIGNGGIDRASDAVAMFAETGVDGVMIGRAAIGNPWIFQQIEGLLTNTPTASHSLAEHKAVIKEHLEALMALTAKQRRRRKPADYSTEQASVMHFRAHLVKYVSGLDGAGRIRQRLNDMRSLEEVMKAVEGIEM
jgi:tRNA-dihydrouridine synthase B